MVVKKKCRQKYKFFFEKIFVEFIFFILLLMIKGVPYRQCSKYLDETLLTDVQRMDGYKVPVIS